MAGKATAEREDIEKMHALATDCLILLWLPYMRSSWRLDLLKLALVKVMQWNKIKQVVLTSMLQSFNT